MHQEIPEHAASYMAELAVVVGLILTFFFMYLAW